MAGDSQSRRVTTLKTYSRRVTTRTEEPPSKKRRLNEVPQVSLPSPIKKAKRSSIRHFFKPLQTSSSPNSTRSVLHSSDSVELPSTSPSSPPSRLTSPISYPRKSQKRPKRRLTTRPVLVQISNMSDTNFNYVGSVDLSNPNPDEDRRDLGQASASDASTSLGTKAVSEATGQAKTGYTNMRGPVTGLPSGLSGCPFTGEIQYHSDGDSSGLQRKERGKQTNYQQTTLDVGLDAFKECKECGMPYNSTRAEDRKAHEDFHKQVVGGVVLKKSSKRPDVTVYSEVIEGVEHRIQALSCKDSPDWRLHFEAALQASYGDLDGPPLDSSVLWSEIQDPQHPQSESLVPRYKVFVYYIAGNIVGVLLAEKVSEAGYFYHGDARYTREGSYDCLVHYNLDEYDRKQQYVYTDETHKVLMCVDRIWVHAEHRFEGIATWLVDIARENFIFNMDIDKKYICFSWPTTMGREFAAKYSEEDDDFKVESARAPIMVKNNRLVDRKEMEEFERRFGMCAK